MKKAQSSAMVLLFVSIAMVIATAMIAIIIIDSVDRSLITTSREKWTTEALLLINRIVNSEDCLAYTKKGVYYDVLEDGSDYVFIGKTSLPNTIDVHKISMERLKSCTSLFTKEYSILFKIEISNKTGYKIEYLLGGPEAPAYNLDPDYYFNPSTAVEVSLPVKIIYDDRVSYGTVKLMVSASAKLFKSRVV